jgi:threonine/homoserine/homoserine lactone efflux protein
VIHDVSALSALALPDGRELALYMTAVFVLNATPGVDLLLTVTRTLQGGARAGLAAALGINAGCVVHAVAAALGLAALLAVSAHTFTVIKWLGAAYLFYLGLNLWRAAWLGRRADEAVLPTQRSVFADFRSGFLTNLLNPKVALFFLAFLPQFISPQAPHKTLAFLALGALFVLQSLVFLALLVALVVSLARASRASRWQASGTVARVLHGVGGALFVGLAWRLMSTTQREP